MNVHNVTEVGSVEGSCESLANISIAVICGSGMPVRVATSVSLITTVKLFRIIGDSLTS